MADEVSLDAGEGALKAKDFAAAERAFSEVLVGSPSSVRALLGRATARFRHGDLLGSAADASKASTLAPQDPAAAAARGRAAYALEEYETAREAYALAARLEPGKKLHASWRDMCDRRLGRDPETEAEGPEAGEAAVPRTGSGRSADSEKGKASGGKASRADRVPAGSEAEPGGRKEPKVPSPKRPDPRPSKSSPARTSGGASTSANGRNDKLSAVAPLSPPSTSSASVSLPSPAPSAACAPPPVQAPSAVSVARPARLQWFQSPNAIEISLLIKGLSLSDVAVDVAPESVTVRGLTDKGRLAAKRIALARRVDPADVSVVARSTKIEIRVRKETPGVLWKDLGEEEEQVVNGKAEPQAGQGERAAATVLASAAVDRATGSAEKAASPGASEPDAAIAGATREPSAATTTVPAPASSAAPSSSLPRPYASKRTPEEWDRLVAGMSAEEAEDESEDAAGFFRKLYANGDDDFRRAMVKSFVESGGTALSTSWEDVAGETGPERWAQSGNADDAETDK